jgi:hypothetical protein
VKDSGMKERRLSMIEADSVISPNLTDREAAELAYGLLWMVGCDRSTKAGEALYLARKALYEKMDRAGQVRGIIAARAALGVDIIESGGGTP